MEYSGLLWPYKVNRLLEDEERSLQLDKGRTSSETPRYQLSVIKINSTYLESVDKYFGWKGGWFLMGTISLVIMVVGYSLLLLVPIENSSSSDSIYFVAFVSMLFIPLISFFAWQLKKEAFAWTHYPIRLNRKNRTLYVFRTNGTILTAPWDKVFFCLGKGGNWGGIQNWDIRGHVLADDGKTVKETFAFSYDSPSQQHVKDHWEFLRRYMEEGPQSVYDQIEFCMPVDGKRESFRAGLERIYANFAGFPVIYYLMWPFNFLWGCARWISMHTCKVPVWPPEIEAVCPVDPNDPYIKDARINPPDLR